jgi:uncharacterized membrane protein required for colicin V production
MTLFDLILILILFGFIWFGFWYGFIYGLGGVVGIVFGALLASRWYAPLAKNLLFLFGGNLNLAKIICFIVLFVILWRLIHLLFKLLDKIVHFLTFIPFLKTINRLAGAILGFLEGALILGLILFFISRFPVGRLAELIDCSEVAQFLIRIAKILWPLLPLTLKQIKGII